MSGETRLEWAPYGVVLGWHAANSPVWVPTLVAASALAGGNAVLARPSSRTRVTTGLVLDAIASAWPQDAVTVVDAPGPEAEPLVWDPGVHAVVAHASTRTCKRQLAGLGAAYAAGARLRPYIPEGSGNDAMIVLHGADLDAAADAAGPRRLRQRRAAVHGGEADRGGAGRLGRLPAPPGRRRRRPAAGACSSPPPTSRRCREGRARAEARAAMAQGR